MALDPRRLTEDMFDSLARAATTSPQTVSRVVGQIAQQLDTSPEDVVRAVREAAGVVGAALLGLAKSAAAAVESAVSAGALTAPAVATTAAGTAGAATTGAASSSGGVVSWFTGLGVVAQAATVVGAVVLTTAVATSITSSPVPEGAAEGYRAVGVEVDGSVRIVSVRHTDAIDAGLAPCDFRHGGNDCDSTVDLVDIDPATHLTPEEATEALCGLLDGPRFAPALSDGWSVPYQGRTVTLDDWGYVDFATCDEVTGG